MVVTCYKQKIITVKESYSDQVVGNGSKSCPANYRLMEIHDNDDLIAVTEYLKKEGLDKYEEFKIGHYINVNDGKWYDYSSDDENKFINSQLVSSKDPSICIYLAYDPVGKKAYFHTAWCSQHQSEPLLCEEEEEKVFSMGKTVIFPLIVLFMLFFAFWIIRIYWKRRTSKI